MLEKWKKQIQLEKSWISLVLNNTSYNFPYGPQEGRLIAFKKTYNSVNEFIEAYENSSSAEGLLKLKVRKGIYEEIFIRNQTLHDPNSAKPNFEPDHRLDELNENFYYLKSISNFQKTYQECTELIKDKNLSTSKWGTLKIIDFISRVPGYVEEPGKDTPADAASNQRNKKIFEQIKAPQEAKCPIS